MELSMLLAQMQMRSRMEREEQSTLQRRFRLAPAMPTSAFSHAHHREQTAGRQTEPTPERRFGDAFRLDSVA